MKIVVNTFEIEIEPSATIWTLKLLIHSATVKKPQWVPIPPDDQKLLVVQGGRDLSHSERTLESYGIREGTQISCRYEACPGEEDFRRFVDVIRKKERIRLKLKKFTRVHGMKHVCGHIHEVESLELCTRGDGGTKRNPEDCELIGHMLKQMPSLRKLDLSYNREMGYEEIKRITEGLERNTSLKEVDLDLCGIGCKSAQRIGEMLKANTSLRKLKLKYNEAIGDRGVIYIADGLEKNTSLKELDLTRCGVRAQGAKRLSEMLEMNASWITLRLWGSYFGDEGAIRIAKGLAANISLKELDLTWCGIQVEGAKGIGEMLRKNSTLMKLDLKYNDGVGDEGAIHIAEGLEMNTSLMELHLMHCGIRVQGAKRLGEMLEKNISLMTICLSDNEDIGDEGAIRIAEGLEVNTSLKCMGLRTCGIGSNGELRMGKMLQKNATLIKLDLQHNAGIGDEGAIRIAEALKMNTSLKELNILSE
eukprot:TRINITY_DN2122_c0_g1_i2.p1 TRINITY_DN2122_c0_g1~~TRINITY_DN2122_c0_g1_i2.p1  ORF type:complete len:476 (+),score=126.65 TRINITY_DN2122_c0_g1_i2:259-1686(+)